MKPIVTSCIILHIFLVSCWAEKKSRNEPVRKNVKEYFFYKPGSYWVMQDSITGRIDSFAVTNSKSIIYNSPELSAEVVSCGMRQFRLNTPGNVDSVTLTLSGGWHVSLGFYPSNDDKYAYHYMMFGGFQPGDSLVGDVTIRNVVYKNVEVSNPYAHDSSNKPIYGSRFYVNKTEGILKMVLPQTDQIYIWELLRSKVIR